MIVKDEKDVIQRCLESVKPLINYYVIVDTGSTDGTQEIIKKTLQSIPGELHERPWKDFAHNRNEALQLAKGKGDYLLFIDADEVFVYEPSFSLRPLTCDSYNFIIKNEIDGQIVSEYTRKLLIKNDLNWAWKGVLHEGIFSSEEKITTIISGISTLSKTKEGSRGKNPKKHLNDAFILEEALKEDPTNLDYLFHLALSYNLAGERLSALHTFEKVVFATPSDRYSSHVDVSLFAITEDKALLKFPLEEVIQACAKSYSYNPARAEALYFLGCYLYDQKHYLLADLVFRKASKISKPLSLSLVITSIYEWSTNYKIIQCSYNLGMFQETKEMIISLLNNSKLPQAVRDDLTHHLKILTKQTF